MGLDGSWHYLGRCSPEEEALSMEKSSSGRLLPFSPLCLFLDRPAQHIPPHRQSKPTKEKKDTARWWPLTGPPGGENDTRR